LDENNFEADYLLGCAKSMTRAFREFDAGPPLRGQLLTATNQLGDLA